MPTPSPDITPEEREILQQAEEANLLLPAAEWRDRSRLLLAQVVASEALAETVPVIFNSTPAGYLKVLRDHLYGLFTRLNEAERMHAAPEPNDPVMLGAEKFAGDMRKIALTRLSQELQGIDPDDEDADKPEPHTGMYL